MSTTDETPLHTQSRIREMLSKAQSPTEAIGQGVGAASVCWEYPERAGLFDSDRATILARELENRLEELAEAAPKGPTGDILHEIGLERANQHQQGYTPEHDDSHGFEHILEQARLRIRRGTLKTRDDLVEAAACIVASIEWMDRATAHEVAQAAAARL